MGYFANDYAPARMYIIIRGKLKRSEDKDQIGKYIPIM